MTNMKRSLSESVTILLIFPGFCKALSNPSNPAYRHRFFREGCGKFRSTHCFSSSTSSSNQSAGAPLDNTAMTFLKKIGKVGGSANCDFLFAVGVDEGASGKTSNNRMQKMMKSPQVYKSCVESGVVDDFSEPFPMSSCGTRWDGFTDRVMGGMSSGQLVREENLHGRVANVLRGRVSLENNGGFVQMALNLAIEGRGEHSVDASMYEGLELDLYNGQPVEAGFETFNVHLKTKDCVRPFSSYRASFDVDCGMWKSVRLPFSIFQGYGPGANEIPLDLATLSRLGVVAIGKDMIVNLAISNVRFY